MSRYIKNVYGKLQQAVDVTTGEIIDVKEKVGERFTNDASYYGSIYDICSKAIYKFDPLHCSALFIYLIGISEIGTNKINISNSKLAKELCCSKSTITRCLITLKQSQTILPYKDYWVINPIIFFRGNYTERLNLYIALNRPAFIISPELFRNEFLDEKDIIIKKNKPKKY